MASPARIPALEALLADLPDLKSELGFCERGLADYKDRQSDLPEDLRSWGAKRKRAYDSKNDAGVKRADAELERLEKDRQEFNSEIPRLETRVASLQTRITTMETQIEEHHRRIAQEKVVAAAAQITTRVSREVSVVREDRAGRGLSETVRGASLPSTDITPTKAPRPLPKPAGSGLTLAPTPCTRCASVGAVCRLRNTSSSSGKVLACADCFRQKQGCSFVSGWC